MGKRDQDEEKSTYFSRWLVSTSWNFSSTRCSGSTRAKKESWPRAAEECEDEKVDAVK